MIRPAGRLILRALAAVIASAAIIFSAVAWRLSAGPLSLAFLTPYLQEALSYGGSANRVEVEDTILTWAGWERALEIRAVEVRVKRPDGTVIATAPELSVGLSVRALLRGRLSPTTIEIIGPKAQLVRDADGRLGFGLGEGDAGSGSLVDLLVGELTAEPGPDGTSGVLSRISILRANLVLEDRPSGTVWRAPEADLILWRDTDGLRAELSMTLDTGGDLTEISVTGRYDPRTERLPLSVRFRDLDIATVARREPRLAALEGLRLPLSGTVQLTVDRRNGAVADIVFDIAGGPGLVDFPQYEIDTLALEELAAQGRLLDDLSTIRLDEFYVDAGGPVISLRGTVALESARPGFDLEGKFRNVPTNDLGRYWPPQLASPARTWVTSNIRGGMITGGDVRLAVPADPDAPLPREWAVIDFEFSGLKVDYLRPMSRMTEVVGSARLTPEKLDLVVDRARVGRLRVSEGTLLIEGLSKGKHTARIGVVVSGTVADSLELADQRPLGLAGKLGVDPSAVAGTAATRLLIELPLKRNVTLADVDVVAAANIRGAAMPDFVEGHQLAKGSLLLKVDRERLTLEGEAAVDGVPMQVFWRREFGPEAPFRNRYRVSGRLTDSDRAALGFSTGTHLSGPVTFSADFDTDGAGRIVGRVSADLDGAAMELPELHWRKEAGAPGTVSFTIDTAPSEPVRIENFELDAGDLRAAGQAEFLAGAFRRLDLARLTFGDNDISVSLRPQARGGYIVAIEGESFDLRPYLDGIVGAEPRAQREPLRLSARLGRLTLGARLAITDVTANAVFTGERWEEFDAVGKFAGDVAFAARVATKGARRIVDITTADAGGVARAADIFTNGVGGKLDLKAEIRDDLAGGPITGRVRITDFRIVNAPTLARILTLGSLTGIVDLLNGEGITFVRADVPFVWSDGRLTLKDASAVGTIGVTMDGVINRAADTLKLGGTIVPAYTLNSVLGNIPLLGNLLVGKKGEGVFALTYGVSGSTDNPKITVNPLSALAPGILRRMFRFDTGGKADAATGQ